MGHMRCGSTLLMHILLTSPEFIGCGERNAPYQSAVDLDKLELAARSQMRAPFRRARYVVDQINHDKFTPNENLLRSQRVRCIFLIRDPEHTIQSILHLTKEFYQTWPASRAVDHYVSRLQTLAAYAVALQGQSFSVTYEDLVDRTPAALQRLKEFLHLESELREEYALQPFTGRRGDPSENISSGRVLHERPPKQPFKIPEEEIQRAVAAYRVCLDALSIKSQ
jgi:hypothetical protein